MTTINLIILQKLKDVNIITKGGFIQNPEILRIADLLLLAAEDLN